MTPTQIADAARARLNSQNDTFYTDAELLQYIYEAELALAKEAKCIERVFTATTTASQRSYAFPTNALGIKRLEIDGTACELIDFSTDDVVTGLQSDTTQMGTTIYYSVWNETLYLRPIPADAVTMTIYAFVEPAVKTQITDSMEVPSRYHAYIIDYLCKQMAFKDENFNKALAYEKTWIAGLNDARRYQAQSKRMAGFASVKDENIMAKTIFGAV